MELKQLFEAVEFAECQKDLQAIGTPISAGAGILPGEENSVMQTFYAKDAEVYRTLCKALERVGFRADYQNQIADNLFGEYSKDDQRIYLYYLDTLKKIRVTQIRNGCRLRDFSYSAPAVAESEFVFFRMACGAEDTYLIRCCDNSWIFIDGGVADYSVYDDSLAEEVYRFMRKQSGLAENEKLVISCWFMTHAHRDHMLAFSSMIKLYHDQIEVQRILCNPPDHTKIVKRNTSLPWFETLQARIVEWYPNVLFLKAQTGMELQLANVHFRILYTQQDHIEEWYTGNPENHNLNYNNSSTVSMITIDNMKILELGDLFFTQDYVAPLYPLPVFECDILKVAHHYIDPHSDEFYHRLLEHRMPDYALVNALADRESWHSQLLKQWMGERMIFGSEDEVYSFQKKGGVTEKTVYPADYYR